MADIISLSTRTQYRHPIQCDPTETQKQCDRYLWTDGECTFHGCKDCPAVLYDRELKRRPLEEINADIAQEKSRTAVYLTAIIYGLTAGVFLNIAMFSAIQGFENWQNTRVANLETVR